MLNMRRRRCASLATGCAVLLFILIACEGPTPLVDATGAETGELAVMVFSEQPELELVHFNTQRKFQRFINRFHMLGDGLMRIQVTNQIDDEVPISERIRKLRKFLTRSGLTDKNMIELPRRNDKIVAAVLSFAISPPK